MVSNSVGKHRFRKIATRSRQFAWHVVQIGLVAEQKYLLQHVSCHCTLYGACADDRQEYEIDIEEELDLWLQRSRQLDRMQRDEFPAWLAAIEEEHHSRGQADGLQEC